MHSYNWRAGVSVYTLFFLHTICVSTVAAESPPSKVTESIREATKECLPGKVRLDPGLIKIKDVNGDNVPDYILDYEHFNCEGGANIHCGSGGCTYQIFIRLTDGTVVKAFNSQVQGISFTKSGGRALMTVDYHGSACGRVGVEPCRKEYRWDGAKPLANSQTIEKVRTEITDRSAPSVRSVDKKPPPLDKVVLIWSVNVDLQEGEIQAAYGEPNTGNVIVSFKCNMTTKVTKIYAGLRAVGPKVGQKSDIVLAGKTSVRVPATAFLNEMTNQIELEGTFPYPADLRDYIVGSKILKISVPGNSASADMESSGRKALEFMTTRC